MVLKLQIYQSYVRKKIYKVNGQHHEREHKTAFRTYVGWKSQSMRCIFKIYIDSAQGPYTTAETFSFLIKIFLRDTVLLIED